MTVCTYYLHWQPLHTENLFVHISSISVNKVFGCLKHFIFNDFALCSRFHCTFVCVCVCASLQVRTSLHNVITSIYVYVCMCVPSRSTGLAHCCTHKQITVFPERGSLVFKVTVIK